MGASYDQSDPTTAATEITDELEGAVLGRSSLERVTSVTTANLSLVTANFVTGSDIDDAEDEIRNSVSGVNLPDYANDPFVVRITSDIFPVMRFSVTGERDIPSLRRVIDSQIVPRLEAVEGVYDAAGAGRHYRARFRNR